MFHFRESRTLLFCLTALCGLAVLSFLGLGLAQPTTTFTLGSDGQDFGYGMTVGPDGSVYVAGATEGSLPGASSQGEWDAVLVKLDADGNMLWLRQYGTAATESARDVAVAPDGSIWVVGQTEGALAGASLGGADAYLARFSAEGELEWARQFGSDADDLAYKVDVDAAGRVVVAGTTYGDMAGRSGTGRNVFVATFDAAGQQLWLAQLGLSFASDDHDSVHDMVIGPDGRIYVAGSGGVPQDLPPGSFASDYDLLLALDIDSGETLLWGYALGRPAEAIRSQARGLAFDSQGNLLVLGQFLNMGEGAWRWLLSRYPLPAPGGDRIELEADLMVPFQLTAWQLVAMNLGVDQHDRPVVVGVTPSGAAGTDAWGSYVFVLEVGEGEVASVFSDVLPEATAQAVGVGPDGRIYVTGSVAVFEGPPLLYDIFLAVLSE